MAAYRCAGERRRAGAGQPQGRWAARVVRKFAPARFGRARVQFGKPFRLSVPLMMLDEGCAFKSGWNGMALGQFRMEAGRQGQEGRCAPYLYLGEHVITRIGQRADVVGLAALVRFVAPALPWVLAHSVAAAQAGTGRIWLPVPDGAGPGGILVCRVEPGPDHRGPEPLLAATFVGRGRLSCFKARLLPRLEAAQRRADPTFPFFHCDEHFSTHGAAVIALADVYDDIRAEEDVAGSRPADAA